MKKYVLLIVTIIVMSLALCGCATEKKSEEIALDKFNYDDYLHYDIYATSTNSSYVKNAITGESEKQNIITYCVEFKAKDKYKFDKAKLEVSTSGSPDSLRINLSSDGTAKASFVVTTSELFPMTNNQPFIFVKEVMGKVIK